MWQRHIAVVQQKLHIGERRDFDCGLVIGIIQKLCYQGVSNKVDEGIFYSIRCLFFYFIFLYCFSFYCGTFYLKGEKHVCDLRV